MPSAIFVLLFFNVRAANSVMIFGSAAGIPRVYFHDLRSGGAQCNTPSPQTQLHTKLRAEPPVILKDTVTSWGTIGRQYLDPTWMQGLLFVASPKPTFLQADCAAKRGAMTCAPTMQWNGQSTSTYFRKFPAPFPANIWKFSDMQVQDKDTIAEQSITLVRSESKTLTRIGPYHQQARLLNLPADGPLHLKGHTILRTYRILDDTAPILGQVEQAFLDATPLLSGGLFF